MDFRFAEEEDAFRKEVRDFLQGVLPPDWLGADQDMIHQDEVKEIHQLGMEIKRKLATMGWLGISWPKEYGGQGASIMKHIILEEELYYQGVPGYDQPTFGVAGPLILEFGTEEQKRRFIPPISRGEVKWAIGMSEPSAGSDLAALQMKAEEKDDCFLLNGQKIWQSGAHMADWCMVYARTDPDVPKHQGISCFLVNLNSPGISMRRLVFMTGIAASDEVFYENVRVPKENLLGQKNGGWSVASASFTSDRTCGLYFLLYAKRDFELLVEQCREIHINEQQLGKDAIIRNRLAQMAIEIEAGYNLAYRLNWMVSRDMSIAVEACQVRVFGATVLQHLVNLGMQILGLYGQLDEKSKWAKLKGRMKHIYLNAIGMTIGAGTSEVSRNFIAAAGLGLPRS